MHLRNADTWLKYEVAIEKKWFAMLNTCGMMLVGC